MKITPDGKMISEGHDPAAAMDLRLKGLLGRINRMLADASLAIVYVYDEGVSPSQAAPREIRVERVRKASATNESVDLGLGIVPGLEGPVAKPDENTEWGVVGDDGMIPIPRGYVVLGKEKVGEETICTFGAPGGEGKKYHVPDSDISLVTLL
jgi:hypothetical protein